MNGKIRAHVLTRSFSVAGIAAGIATAPVATTKCGGSLFLLPWFLSRGCSVATKPYTLSLDCLRSPLKGVPYSVGEKT
jgi:hypothetical protein